MTERKTGVDNVFSMLNRIFKEAQHLNRIPVIGGFNISQRHNMGDNRTDLRFEDYLDLSNGITVQLQQGCHKPTASHLDWMKEQELDLANYAPDEVYNLNDDEIVTEEMNQRYDVLIRRDPTFKYATVGKKYKYGRYLIDFPYSEKVNTLTDEVLSSLGIFRHDAMVAQQYFLNRVSSSGWNQQYDSIPLNKVYYACMHVRASIKDRDSGQPIFPFAAVKKQIKSVLEHSIAKGSRLYIMSDIHQPDFFDFLKSNYRTYRYHDFPELKKLVSGEDGRKIDNVMLYLVEKNIMKYATVKILAPHKGPMIYNLNTVYDLTFLKEPPSMSPTDKKPVKKRLLKKLFAMKMQKFLVTKWRKLNPKSVVISSLNKNLPPNKYLLFSMTGRKTGVDNVFRMLNLIFKEAKHLNRIPVIGEFTMSPTHNLGDSRTDLRFEDYLDLSSSVTVQFEQGYHRSNILSQGWIKEKELNLASYASDKVHNLAADEIVSEELNQHYDVLIRRDPTFDYINICDKYIPANHSIDFPYSERVNRLVDETLNALGVSRKAAVALQHYFLNRNHKISDVQHEDISLDKVYYACMHVRASIKDRDYEQPIFPFTASKQQIKSVLEHAINKDSRLYIMSDIHRTQFFDFLRADYRVYRYYDFPNLRKLVSGEGGEKIDNVMLYLVEKNIMKYATVKILPPHKGPMTYHLNTVYDLSFLKNPPTVRERQDSEKVSKLVDEMLDTLGTSREDAMAAQRYFLMRTYGEVSDEQHDGISLDKVYYACMHVHTLIEGRYNEQSIFPFAALKDQIKSVLKHAISKGSRLYIISDIYDPKFFNFLKSDYQVYRYYGFPNLRQLVLGKDGTKINSAILDLIEENIMKYATVKILPPHKGPMIYNLNTAYNLSLLKELPTTTERPDPQS